MRIYQKIVHSLHFTTAEKEVLHRGFDRDAYAAFTAMKKNLLPRHFATAEKEVIHRGRRGIRTPSFASVKKTSCAAVVTLPEPGFLGWRGWTWMRTIATIYHRGK